MPDDDANGRFTSESLFAALPVDRALVRLCPSQPVEGEVRSVAAGVVACAKPEIAAAVWLYVDDLDRSHAVSQGIHTATGSFWHGIMHRREGDFANSKYWFRQVGSHPVIEQLGYDPFEFVDRVSRECRENPADLVEMQRREWKALYDWCVGGER